VLTDEQLTAAVSVLIEAHTVLDSLVDSAGSDYGQGRAAAAADAVDAALREVRSLDADPRPIERPAERGAPVPISSEAAPAYAFLAVAGSASSGDHVLVPAPNRCGWSSGTTEVALLDRAGVIVAVNGAWEAFSRENDGDPAQTGVGTSYLQVCAAAAGDVAADQAAAAIRAALAGDPAPISMQIPCDAPGVPRWFDLLVSSRMDDRGHCVGATVTLSRALCPTDVPWAAGEARRAVRQRADDGAEGDKAAQTPREDRAGLTTRDGPRAVSRPAGAASGKLLKRLGRGTLPVPEPFRFLMQPGTVDRDDADSA